MNLTTRDNPLLRDLLILAGVALLLLAVTAAGADTIRLNAQAVAGQGPVKLRDIATLEGPDAVALADTVVIETVAPGREVVVTLTDVREKLTAANVNWGRLSLGGYHRCRVQGPAEVKPPVTTQVDPKKTDAPAAPVETPAPALANPMQEVTADAVITLRDHVVGFIEQFAGVGRSELQIKFADSDASVLDQSIVGQRLEVEPVSVTALGRVPLIVRRYDGDRLLQTHRLTMDVARRVLAVVAAAGISHGQTIAAGDVMIREVYIDDAKADPMTDLARVVGQTCVSVLRQGAIVQSRHLRSPVLIKRGDLVTVRCLAGGLVVKTTARALEDGSLDQVIRVRSDRGSQQTYSVKVTGVRETQIVAGAESHQQATTDRQGGDA